MIRAALIASVSDPNRSALIPNTSPTLSPTLSAITPGFLPLSLGYLCSSLPDKSLPTVAAFEYMPPPTLENKATVDAPRPKPATI